MQSRSALQLLIDDCLNACLSCLPQLQSVPPAAQSAILYLQLDNVPAVGRMKAFPALLSKFVNLEVLLLRQCELKKVCKALSFLVPALLALACHRPLTPISPASGMIAAYRHRPTASSSL